jgi:hypothetical protein
MPHWSIVQVACIAGEVFKASDYPMWWAPGEPNGTNDATGRYLVYSKAGLEDVPENFQSTGVMCMGDANSYRINVKTGKPLTYWTNSWLIKCILR